jgi:hypothetical protein
VHDKIDEHISLISIEDDLKFHKMEQKDVVINERSHQHGVILHVLKDPVASLLKSSMKVDLLLVTSTRVG